MASPERRESAAREYVARVQDVLSNLPFDAICRALELLETARAHGRRVFVAGNGGSAATASHMATDFAKTAARGFPGAGLRAIALTDSTPLLTAIGNDLGYASTFAYQLRTLAARGDVLIVISGSGDSPNVLEALQAADELGVTTISLLGRTGGKSAGRATVDVIVPAEDYGLIEDAHLVLNHLITAYIGQFAAAPSV